MQPNRRIHANRSQSRRIHLDPHYFTGFIQRHAHSLGNSHKPRVSQVSYDITMAEVLEDLSYGRD